MKFLGEEGFDESEVMRKIDALIARFAGSKNPDGVMLFRPRAIPPPIIYKCTSAKNAELIFRSMKFRYTQSEVLDDIFEESPSHDEIRSAMPGFEDGPTIIVDVTDPPERLEMFDRVRDARNAMREAGEILSPDVAVITSNGLTRGWRYELGNQKFKSVMENMRKPLALSLTIHGNSPRMWSEYADSHKGVMIGLDSRSKYFRSNRDFIDRDGFFAPVIYRNISMSDYAFRYPYERFFIKMQDWADQGEWRRIKYEENNTGIDWQKKNCLVDFPAEIVRFVAFGARCSNSNSQSIVENIRSRSNLAHVKFKNIKFEAGKLFAEDF